MMKPQSQVRMAVGTENDVLPMGAGSQGWAAGMRLG